MSKARKKWKLISFRNNQSPRDREVHGLTDKLARDTAERISRGNVRIQYGKVITREELDNLEQNYLSQKTIKFILDDD